MNITTIPYNYNFSFDIYCVGIEQAWDSDIAPKGWLFKHGQLVLREDYPRLFEWAVKNNLIVSDDDWLTNKKYALFSYGDGETTFRIPDKRGVYDVGYEAGYHSGLSIYQQDQIQGHSHLYDLPRGDRSYGNGGGNSLWGGFNWTFTTHDLVSDGRNDVPRVGNRTQPRSLPRNYIIKY